MNTLCGPRASEFLPPRAERLAKCVRVQLSVGLEYLVTDPEASLVINIHPARTAAQAVTQETLAFNADVDCVVQTERSFGNRLLRVTAPPGVLHISYAATITIEHLLGDPASIQETCVPDLPVEVLPYLMPSRYCESDRLGNLAHQEFGGLAPGYARVQAINDWVGRHIMYVPNSSTTATSAVDTLAERVGVCRDFAHVMIALCRALCIPARFVTGTNFGASPERRPDFHAYVEVYLDGCWYLFDPSAEGIPMGYIRIGTGRDAADVPFATLFGEVAATHAPFVRSEAIAGGDFTWPRRVTSAISTDAHSMSWSPGGG